MYGEHRVKRQIPERIIPPCNCYPYGKRWKIDFGIANARNPKIIDFYVKAKGLFTPSFADTLAMFELNNLFNFNRLYLVFSNQIPKDKKVIKALTKTTFDNNLLTLKELKQITELP